MENEGRDNGLLNNSAADSILGSAAPKVHLSLGGAEKAWMACRLLNGYQRLTHSILLPHECHLDESAEGSLHRRFVGGLVPRNAQSRPIHSRPFQRIRRLECGRRNKDSSGLGCMTHPTKGRIYPLPVCGLDTTDGSLLRLRRRRAALRP